MQDCNETLVLRATIETWMCFESLMKLLTAAKMRYIFLLSNLLIILLNNIDDIYWSVLSKNLIVL